VLAAKFGEIDYQNSIATWVAKSMPGQWHSVPVRAGQRTDVESDLAMSAISPVDPLLFRTQQVGCCDVLQDLEFKIPRAVQIPGVLQVNIVVASVPQCASMIVPALAQVHRAPNIDLPVSPAAYPVDP
jgi:hypothetical protein